MPKWTVTTPNGPGPGSGLGFHYQAPDADAALARHLVEHVGWREAPPELVAQAHDEGYTVTPYQAPAVTWERRPPPASDRPRCACCDKPRRPLISTERHGGHASPYRYVKAWTGRWLGYGHFCTLGCAQRFAEAAHAAGYRIIGEARP